MLDEMVMELAVDGDYNARFFNSGRKFMTLDAAINLAAIIAKEEAETEGASC